jgi:adenosylhomocysteine nucleosidase
MKTNSSVILVSADAEWRAVQKLFPRSPGLASPYGEYFYHQISSWQCVFFHAGWGKIAAAASTQYVIDRFHPQLLLNLGTCGGFAGDVDSGEILLVEKTIVYDIIEQMGDFDEHIRHYTTDLDLSWLGEPLPIPVRRTMLVSGDRDLLVEDISSLQQKYQAVAGDWESGAIAWVAKRNDLRLLILRGVTDLVGSIGSPAYGDMNFFETAAFEMMGRLVKSLPGWFSIIQS